MNKLEHMLRNGWAVAIYIADDGNLHMGLIEREPIEDAVLAQKEGEDEWGQAMVTLEGWSFTKEPSEALAAKLDHTASIAYDVFCGDDDGE